MIGKLIEWAINNRLVVFLLVAALAGIGTQLFFGVVRMMIFDAFYRSSSALQPLTREQVITYIWLGQAMLLLTMLAADTDVAAMIRTGNVAYEMTRPIDLYSLWFTRALSGTVNYSFSSVDSDESGTTQSHTALTVLTYRLSAKTSTSLQTFGTITDRSAGEPDSRLYGASMGVRRQLTPSLAAFVAIGPSVLEREGRGTRVFPNLQANLDGTLPLTRRTTLTFSAGQSIQNTAGKVDDVGVVLNQSANLALSHAVSRDLQTSLLAGYTRTELLEDTRTCESGQGRQVNSWTAGARISYALTRLLSLAVSYGYQHRDSNVPSSNFNQCQFGTNFDENRVTVSLTAAFPVF